MVHDARRLFPRVTGKPELESRSIGASDLIRPVWEEDGTTQILFGVIGLIRRDASSNGQGDLFLSFKFHGVNRLRIQVKRRAHLRVAKKLLNRLYTLALANQKRSPGSSSNS